MDTALSLIQGISIAMQPINFLVLLIGLTIGLAAGIIPGISAANGMALLVPVVYAFGLEPGSALILYGAVYYGSKYGGRVGGVLLNSSGDAGSTATRLDGYPMALAGKAGTALRLSAASSFLGGLMAVILLSLLFPAFAYFGEKFGPPEYLALIMFVFGLSLILAGGTLSKTISSLCLGLILSSVGLDWATDVLRYTFGVPELFDGIDFIVVIVGVFAVSETFIMMGGYGASVTPVPLEKERPPPTMPLILAHKFTTLRASIYGFIIGILPGTGSSTANIVSYQLEKLVSNKDGTFGSGDIRGVIAPETANSASSIGSFMPLITLGIPGSATTAVLLGALWVMNIDPSPVFYKTQPELVWGLIGSIYIGNVILLIVNLRFMKWLTRLLLIPRRVLMPLIIVISFVSVYAVQQSMVSILLMLTIGLLAFGLRIHSYPLAPLILGYILGKPFEDNLRIALAITGGDYSIFYQGWIAPLFWMFLLICLIIKGCFEIRRA